MVSASPRTRSIGRQALDIDADGTIFGQGDDHEVAAMAHMNSGRPAGRARRQGCLATVSYGCPASRRPAAAPGSTWSAACEQHEPALDLVDDERSARAARRRPHLPVGRPVIEQSGLPNIRRTVRRRRIEATDDAAGERGAGSVTDLVEQSPRWRSRAARAAAAAGSHPADSSRPRSPGH